MSLPSLPDVHKHFYVMSMPADMECITLVREQAIAAEECHACAAKSCTAAEDVAWPVKPWLHNLLSCVCPPGSGTEEKRLLAACCCALRVLRAMLLVLCTR